MADLAIGAGGSATWERCALGLPALVTSFAINQIELSKNAASCGVIYYLGDAKYISISDLKAAIINLTNKPEILMSLSNNGLKEVDGLGVSRVMTSLVAV